MAVKYEVLLEITEDTGESRLVASYTPNNGIRIGIMDDDLGPDWVEFDFSAEQAKQIGEALLRWSKR